MQYVRGKLSSVLFLLAVMTAPVLLKLTVNNSPVGFGRSIVARDNNASRLVATIRMELLMALDLLIRAERAIAQDSYQYTRALGRVPDVLGSSPYFYRIDIVRSTKSEILVTATGEARAAAEIEVGELVGDHVSIDEHFSVSSNFPIPMPPRGYLHTLAKTVMNQIFAGHFEIPSRARLEDLEGVFRGFFRYEIRTVSQGGRTLVAVGLKDPVLGDVVEMEPGANLFVWVREYRQGEALEREVKNHLDQIYIAQRIHRDHVGGYTPSFEHLVSAWNSLERLKPSIMSLSVGEFQVDPTFGFQADIVARRNAAERVWAVNGYGQVNEISTLEAIMSQFQRNRSTAGSSVEAVAPAPERSRKAEEVFAMPAGVSDTKENKPLVIDSVDSTD